MRKTKRCRCGRDEKTGPQHLTTCQLYCPFHENDEPAIAARRALHIEAVACTDHEDEDEA
jgi:hypothetical protein